MVLSTLKIKKYVRRALKNRNLRKAVFKATVESDHSRKDIIRKVPYWEKLREINHLVKKKVINNLDKYLLEFENNCIKNGIHVHWANDDQAAREIIGEIAKNNKVEKIVKSKSLTTEEIKLNPYLIKQGLEVTETDLGEYIMQLRDEPPSHLIIPALQLSRQEIGHLFNQKLGCGYMENPLNLLQVARKRLREKFLEADMGITGANFAIADTGCLCIVENEANAHLTLTLPKIHVALVGIEKLIPTLNDLPGFLKVLAPSATGQKFSSYVNIVKGPLWDTLGEGAQQVHVILLDNGRSGLLGKPMHRESLACIRCGTCLNVCPVFQQIGGHAYGWVYMGPIGIVLAPLFLGINRGFKLTTLCSLCRACFQECPLKINLPAQIIKLREEIASKGYSGTFEKLAFQVWGYITKNPRLNRFVFAFFRRIQRFLLLGKSVWLPGYTKRRAFPPLSDKSFTDLYNYYNSKNPKKGNQ